MTRDITAGGIFWQLWGEEAGAAHAPLPLVILHGLFGTSDNWRSQAAALAANRLVLVADMPDHGRSQHGEAFSYPAAAETLWGALDEALKLLGRAQSSVVLLGHSLGGKAAMTMALGRPQRCARLIVVDIAPRKYPPRHDEIFDALEAVAAAAVDSRGEADRIMARFIAEKETRMFLLKELIRRSPDDARGYGWRLNVAGLRAGYAAILSWPYAETAITYSGDTLFVVGGNSDYVRRGDHAAIRRHFPRAAIRTIEGVGHLPHAEARTAFLATVGEFLA